MLAQKNRSRDVTDEQATQAYLDQALMAAFCRALDASCLPPMVVMRMAANALGATYREVAVTHQDRRCPCGWQPSPATDIEAIRSAVEAAAISELTDDVRLMTAAGHA